MFEQGRMPVCLPLVTITLSTIGLPCLEMVSRTHQTQVVHRREPQPLRETGAQKRVRHPRLLHDVVQQ